MRIDGLQFEYAHTVHRPTALYSRFQKYDLALEPEVKNSADSTVFLDYLRGISCGSTCLRPRKSVAGHNLGSCWNTVLEGEESNLPLSYYSSFPTLFDC